LIRVKDARVAAELIEMVYGNVDEVSLEVTTDK